MFIWCIVAHISQANKASQATKAYASPVGSVKLDLVLGHTVSSMYDDSQTRNSQMCSRSTDCPDIVSAEDDDMRENESESSSDDE